MGMAASQARLLSITSRMSDNELRAQLINNAKMRLTSDSSQVSDDYIAALNATQLMFSNYDTSGNEQYQELTFNSLTAYSSYNNQYGIVNSAGQLLVSSTDAANYEASENVTEFLEKYGLTNSTSYFESYDTDTVYYYDDYGAAIDTGVLVSDMEDAYLNYSTDLNSEEYDTYLGLVDDYDTAKATYDTVLTAAKNDYLDSLNIDTLYLSVMNLSSYSSTYADYLLQIMSSLGVSTSGEWSNSGSILNENSDTFISALYESYNTAVSTAVGTKITTYDYDESDNGNYVYVKVDSDGNYSTSDTASVDTYHYLVPVDDEEDADVIIDSQYYAVTTTIPTSGTYYTLLITDTSVDDDDDYTYEKLYTDGNGNYKVESELTSSDSDDYYAVTNSSSYDYYITSDTYTYTDEMKLADLQYCWTYLKNNIFVNLSDDYTQWCTDSDTLSGLNEAKQDYEDAVNALAAFIYGDGVTIDEEYWDYLSDPVWVLSQNYYDDEIDGYTDVNYTHYNPYNQNYSITSAYETIKSIFLVESMLDIYGEPTYTWIDENDADENAEAKAQWYINLYERMSEGYAILPDNLLDSQEWLQFAFESGLVHMEQVDSSNTWVSTMYSNCSSITESTVDVDITVAEAEYTREMNKIEAKDQKYDLELKNIDTEHTSLETEYESIKSVIEKNIERNFKIFQA